MVVFSLRVGGPLSAAQFAKFRFQDSELIPRLDDNSHIVYVYIHIYVHMMYTYIYIKLWLVDWNIIFIFPYIGNVIIPTDELIFFRGVETTNQICWIPILDIRQVELEHARLGTGHGEEQ
jgi:hypothetical protein